MGAARLGAWRQALQRRLGLYDATDAQAAVFRAQQRQAVLRLTPMAMSIQLACALVVPLTLWQQVSPAALLAWALAVAALAAISRASARGFTSQPGRARARPRRRS